MKKYSLLFFTVLVCLMVLAACGASDTTTIPVTSTTPVVTNPLSSGSIGTPDTPVTPTTTEIPKKTITGIALDDKTVVYDGNEQTLTYTGSLPEGVTATITYQNEALSGVTDAGSYLVKAVFVGESYETLTLTATLTVTPASFNMTGVSLESKVVTYDGTVFSLQANGIDTLPEGTQVSYTYSVLSGEGSIASDGVSAEGRYKVVACFSLKNYTDASLEAILEIKPKATIGNIAATVVAAFGKAPDLWSYLPESMAFDSATVNGSVPTFENDTALSEIPTAFRGKQLNVLYASMADAQATLGVINTIYNGMTAITALYQDYIDKNPDDYAVFEGDWSIFSIHIEMTEEAYIFFAKASGITVELYADLQNGKVLGRASVAEKSTLKYETSEDRIRLAVNLAEVRTTDIEFVKKDGTVIGSVYETIGYGNARLTTAALISITEDYTIAVGNKGDFLVPGMGINVEVYSNKSGKLIGSEVYETIKTVDYDTLWYPLTAIDGIDSIKAVIGTSGEENKMNPDSIFINGSATAFVPKFNSILGVKTSRQFDIEMKTVTVYTYDDEKEAYLEQEIEIPMLFVQRANLDSYLADMKKTNGMQTMPENTTSSRDDAAISSAYETYMTAYEAMKSLITYETTIAYIGSANAWFQVTAS